MIQCVNGVNNSGQAEFNVSKFEKTFTNSIFTGNSTQQTKKDALQIDMEKRQKAHKKAQAKVNNALARAKQNIGVVETTPNDSIKIRDFRMGESANKKLQSRVLRLIVRHLFRIVMEMIPLHLDMNPTHLV